MSETEKEELTLRQIEGERLALDHQGEFGLHGTHSGPPMQHAVAAQFEHTTPSNQPLVHMVCWDEERACELNGRIVVAGDDKAPVHVRMAHDFTNEHHQHHRVEPVEPHPARGFAARQADPSCVAVTYATTDALLQPVALGVRLRHGDSLGQ